MRELNQLINKYCTCGGSGPGESDCVACNIYHDLKDLDNAQNKDKKPKPEKPEEPEEMAYEIFKPMFATEIFKPMCATAHYYIVNPIDTQPLRWLINELPGLEIDGRVFDGFKWPNELTPIVTYLKHIFHARGGKFPTHAIFRRPDKE